MTLTWTNQTITFFGIIRYMDVDRVLGRVIGITNSFHIQISTDGGVTWSQVSPDPNSDGAKFSIAYGNGVWLMGGGTDVGISVIYRSTDNGATWNVAATQPSNFTSNSTIPTLIFSPTLGTGSGMWVALQGNTGINRAIAAISTDSGQTWSAGVTISGTQSILYPYVRLWDGSQFIAGGRDTTNNFACIFTSPDGVTWSVTQIQSFFTDEWDMLAWNGTVYMLGSASNRLIRKATSIAGLVVPTMPPFGNVDLSTALPNSTTIGGLIALGPNLWVASGINNSQDVAESTDGVTWTQDVSNIPAADSVFTFAHDPIHTSVIGTGGGITNCVITAPFGLVTVPNVVGTSFNVGKSLISGASLVLGTVTTVAYSPIVGPGRIASQSLTAGSQVAPNSVINITVRGGSTGLPGEGGGGQTNSPNKNIAPAPAGLGGDKWGANGGGITPIGGGLPTSLGGYDESVMVAMSDANRSTNYISDQPNDRSLLSETAITAILHTDPDDLLPVGGSNMG